MKERESYSKEFKIQAVKLLEAGEKSGSELAMELGVKRTLLYRWKDQVDQKGEKAFKNGSGRPKLEDQSELARLRSENKVLKEERDILKKAAAYFAKDLI